MSVILQLVIGIFVMYWMFKLYVYVWCKMDDMKNEENRRLAEEAKFEQEEEIRKVCDRLNIDMHPFTTCFIKKPGETYSSGLPVYKTSYDLYPMISLHCEGINYTGFFWYDEKQDAIAIVGWCNGLVIKREEILYYKEDNYVSHSTKLINNGKNISVSGAVIGGAIAGDVGALIGSQAKANQYSTESKKDVTVGLSIYFTQEGVQKVASVDLGDQWSNTEKFSRFFNAHFQEKNLAFIEAEKYGAENSIEAEDSENEIETRLHKIRDLYEKNIITEDEYEEQRKRILASI